MPHYISPGPHAPSHEAGRSCSLGQSSSRTVGFLRLSQGHEPGNVCAVVVSGQDAELSAIITEGSLVQVKV